MLRPSSLLHHVSYQPHQLDFVSLYYEEAELHNRLGGPQNGVVMLNFFVLLAKLVRRIDHDGRAFHN